MDLLSKVFDISNNVSLLGWFLLIFFPRKKITKILVIDNTLILVNSVVYLVSILIYFKLSDLLKFDSLENVVALFTSKELVFSGWIHFLAFDLFVGKTLLIDSWERNISHYLMVPVLLLTYIFGPIGLITYSIIFSVRKFYVARNNT